MHTEFMQSFNTYGDAIFRFCLVKVSNQELAEDMTQETFMRYWQSLRAGKTMTNTRSFLYTIANNLAKDWYKKKKADSLDSFMDTGFEPKTTEVSPEVNAAHNELIAAMQDMEAMDKEVLLLRHVEGLPPKDIADILGETANTVSVRLNRATTRLKHNLGI